MKNILKLTAIKYGETFIDEGMAYRGGDKTKKVPISLIIYLIETQDRKILVDSGCDTMPGFELSHFSSPAEVLRLTGLDPLDITELILTHAHHDHAEATHHFKNATVYIEEGEARAARGFFPDEMKVCVFREGAIVGDAVRAVKIGGHSWGSCAVEFDYKGKAHVICGDECYVRRCLDEKICTGVSVCPEKSLEFVNKYGSGDYVTLLCHDGEILKGRNGVLEL